MNKKTEPVHPYRHVTVRLQPATDRGQLRRVAELFDVTARTTERRAS